MGVVSRISRPWRSSRDKSPAPQVTDDDANSFKTNEKSELKIPPLEYDHDPTQFSFFSSNLDSARRASSISSLESSHPPFRDLLETGNHEAMWWLDVVSPSKEDIEELAKAFSIHPLTTEDIKDGETREKFELFGNYYFLSLRPPQETDQKTSYLNMYAIVFRRGILSFTFGTSPHVGNIQNRMMERNQIALTSDWICYALIDDIVDGFGPLIDQVEQSIENMEDNFSISRPDDIGLVLQWIYRCRKEITRIRHMLHDKIDVIKCFARHCEVRTSTDSSDVNLYLSDIQDHVLAMMANLAHSEQMLSSSQSKCLGQISMDSTRSRNATVDTLSKLSVIASILVPMQLITFFFAMNVPVPGGEHGTQWWYVILGVILGIIMLSLTFAKFKRWI
ncbi:hypothetical protein ASPWEDRAFT_41339 [Aspergillus wentii DTO 134E9]|uniref:Uncharacterized protein n=1 Tax=Aspergillus wentii DTO 134E9 TaxID=1073089 RepID=A0A1L9RMR0_ASPWE|nr:uncharacterized protein ASPWEDRAFT_41339 [Aspergillus wentii DTO 134E9]OJJ36108.1 hypothetical protein ASPWEDRAFT_41339 [Aspergillus wentii DTO 134E9]